MRKVREQSRVITIANGTSQGTVLAAKISLDTSYEKATGVHIVEIKNGGLPYYRLSVQDDAGTTQTDMMHKKTYEYDPEREFKQIDVQVVERQMLIQVELPQNLTDDLVFELTFKLENL